jgi:flagellar biosynthetic protein FlhB
MANSERTEKATPGRRKKARDKGQFAYSPEVTGVLTLFACLGVAYSIFSNPSGYRSFFESMLNAAISTDSDVHMTAVVRQAGYYFLMSAAPIFAAAIIAALVGNVLQGLPVFASEKVGINFEALNPISGLSRLKGKISPLEWVKILLLIGAAVGVLWSTINLYWPQLVASPAYSISASNNMILGMLVRIVSYLGGATVVLAVGDFFLQRYKFEESIKMSKAEVKEDAKSNEGNPTIKGKIRSIQRERARKRMLARIKEATVIVTNPTHFAVALEYRPETMGAPRVIAKGQDFLAQKIKAIGRDNDIPLVENVPLARALYRSVEIDQEIPNELFKAVAEVLAFVYRTRKSIR